MNTPKRLHEEGTNSSSLKRPLEDTGGSSGLAAKLTTSITNTNLPPFEPGQDARAPKYQRNEPREVDKRLSILQRMSSSPSNILDNPISSGNKQDFKNPKDSIDIKADIRETKSEVRESRVYTPANKAENEVRLDRSSHSDLKSETKFESSHSSWKESKELLRGKKYVESPVDNLDSWRIARHGAQNTPESGKSRAEEWDSSEVHETVGENKVDVKCDEKIRDDRKKEELKYREEFKSKDKVETWSDPSNKDNKEERRLDTAWKEANRERKEEIEKLEREKKDVKVLDHIEKEDNIKKELPSSSEKDDTAKVSDRDFKDRTVDRLEHMGKSYDKELDDESAEGEGATERDREASGNSGIQQRRRMLRTKGSCQTPNREPRSRPRAQENEGSQGKSAYTVVYKAGECMQELLKSWKEYETTQKGKTDEASENYPALEIRIPAEYVTSSNRQVRGAQLWGTDIYTNDSDLFAVLMHTGYCRPTSSPPAGIQELRATIRVLPPQDNYTSTLRNNVRSRAWGAGVGCSYRVEHCCIAKKGGGIIDLEPRLTYISALEPTLAPVSVERTMTTRSAATNALRQQRFVREVSIQYNLCCEPWLKYSISVVADKGLKKPLYTSARLKKGEVLYLETHSKRYELCYNGEKAICNGSAQIPESEQRQNHSTHVQNGDKSSMERENLIDIFRFSLCKKILPQDTMLSIGIPMRTEDLEVIADNLEWEDLQWSHTGVLVTGITYHLARAHFFLPKKN